MVMQAAAAPAGANSLSDLISSHREECPRQVLQGAGNALWKFSLRRCQALIKQHFELACALFVLI